MSTPGNAVRKNPEATGEGPVASLEAEAPCPAEPRSSCDLPAPAAGERSARRRTAAVIVAHPDDETLWAGGTILMHPAWSWTVVTLCRKSDPDRAAKFYRALTEFGASGAMADLDDGPEQEPLRPGDVERAVLSVLPGTEYYVLVTHGPCGEYTTHRRHGEVCRAVVSLWKAGAIRARKLWMFAYDDGGGRHLPRATARATVRVGLPSGIWRKKHDLIEKTYGFTPDSFEARTTPVEEAFWFFASPEEAEDWIRKTGGA